MEITNFNHFQVCDPVALSTFRDVVQSASLFPEHFHHPKWNLCIHSTITPRSPWIYWGLKSPGGWVGFRQFVTSAQIILRLEAASSSLILRWNFPLGRQDGWRSSSLISSQHQLQKERNELPEQLLSQKPWDLPGLASLVWLTSCWYELNICVHLCSYVET